MNVFENELAMWYSSPLLYVATIIYGKKVEHFSGELLLTKDKFFYKKVLGNLK